MLLPSGRIYGLKRLEDLSSKLGLPAGKFRDPTTGEDWEEGLCRKIFIS